VDDNKNDRQRCLSFEEAFVPKNVSLHNFGFAFGVAFSNAHFACNYIALKTKDL